MDWALSSLTWGLHAWSLPHKRYFLEKILTGLLKAKLAFCQLNFNHGYWRNLCNSCFCRSLLFFSDSLLTISTWTTLSQLVPLTVHAASQVAWAWCNHVSQWHWPYTGSKGPVPKEILGCINRLWVYSVRVFVGRTYIWKEINHGNGQWRLDSKIVQFPLRFLHVLPHTKRSTWRWYGISFAYTNKLIAWWSSGYELVLSPIVYIHPSKFWVILSPSSFLPKAY